MGGKWGYPPPFFWKCVKRKGFKSFVLKVCETKGVADAFLGNCVKLKSLGGILASFRSLGRSFVRGPWGDFLQGNQRRHPSGAWR